MLRTQVTWGNHGGTSMSVRFGVEVRRMRNLPPAEGGRLDGRGKPSVPQRAQARRRERPNLALVDDQDPTVGKARRALACVEARSAHQGTVG